MNAQQLRNSILQQAIQGKLVPQDPNDEPASVLLQRIRKEKERLVKEGELKKKDLESKPIEEDEIPFEIPESWEWVRLNCITELIEDCPHSTAPDEGKGYPLIRTSNVGFGRLLLKGVHRVSESVYNKRNERAIPQQNDLIYAREATAGNIAVIEEGQKVCLGQRTVLVRPMQGLIDSYWLAFFILSPYSYTKLVGESTGTTVAHVNLADFRPHILPLPPLAEQRRIVAKIEELMPLVERYGKAQQVLDQLNESLPARLRQSILQEAIQGRLVPQDPKEEPASELLKRIRKEKEQLVKEGKLKKKDLESKPIEEDEIPFEIPESWEWVRLGEISTYSHTKKKINASKADSHIWGLDLEDIEKGGRLLCIKTVEERKAIGDKTYFNSGDILYSKLRPYLLKILVAPKDGICTPEIIPFTCYGNISSNYIVDVLKSAYVDDYINSVTFGVKMPRVSTETMTSLLIPLPPLSEQKRIVAKVEELFGVMKV